MHLLLFDSCKIEEPYSGQPICTRNEVERTLDMLVGCSYKKVIKPDKNIRVIFYSNGHLVGAVLTLIVISSPGAEDINLLYTGDYKDSNMFFDVELPPKQIRNLNISAFFTEATYGNVGTYYS